MLCADYEDYIRMQDKVGQTYLVRLLNKVLLIQLSDGLSSRRRAYRSLMKSAFGPFWLLVQSTVSVSEGGVGAVQNQLTNRLHCGTR